eukprot:TRINITY_DN3333_c5_g1_i1.p1 TRINITY_DN3333_c5_g1~~TRINITY_DN3333_c5_g1_i1.p1  ORF type:complete len:862 (+),score=176.78 TRINITY_DN3333_c5_g1_i1:278-2863(+)
MKPVRPTSPPNDRPYISKMRMRATSPWKRRKKESDGIAVSGNSYVPLRKRVLGSPQRRTPPSPKSPQSPSHPAVAGHLVQQVIYDKISDVEFVGKLDCLVSSERNMHLKELLFQFKRAKGFVAISQGFSIDELYAYIVAATRHQLHCENAVLHVYSSKANLLYHPLTPTSRVCPGSGLAKKVIVHKQKIHVSFGVHTTQVKQDQILFGKNCTELLSIPLMRTMTGKNLWMDADPAYSDSEEESTGPPGTEVIGMLTAINKTGGYRKFTGTDQALLEALGQQASACLTSCMEKSELKGMKTQLTSFLESSSCFSIEHTAVEEIMHVVDEHAKKLLRAERCGVFLYDGKDSSRLMCTLPDGTVLKIPSKGGVVGVVLETGTLVNIPSAYLDPRFNTEVDRVTGFNTTSVLCIPIKRHSGGKVIGVLEVLNKTDGSVFNETDELAGMAFAMQLSFVLQHNETCKEHKTGMKRLMSVLSAVDVYCVVLDGDMVAVEVHMAEDNPLGVHPNDLMGKHVSKWFPAPSDKTAITFNSRFLSSIAEAIRETNTAIVEIYQLRTSPTDHVAVKYAVVPLGENRYGLFLSVLAPSLMPSLLLQANASNDICWIARSDQSLIQTRSLRGTVVTVPFNLKKHYHTPHILFEKRSMLVEQARKQAKRYGGVVCRWQGDAVVIVIGLPFPKSDDAETAVKLCIDLRRVTKDEFHIGVHTGTVMCGMSGDNYECEGPVADMSKHLSTAAVYYRASVLVSNTTLEALNKSFYIRDIDKVCFNDPLHPGPFPVFEVLGPTSVPVSPLQEKLQKCLAEALEAYRCRNWHHASNMFHDVAELYRDPVSEVFFARCLALKRDPPQAKWNGCWDIVNGCVMR